MTKLAQLVVATAVAALVGGAAGAEPTRNGLQLNGLQLNGLHLNGLHLNGLHLNGLQLNGMHLNDVCLNGHRIDWCAAEAPTVCGVVRETDGSRISRSLRVLAAEPLMDE